MARRLVLGTGAAALCALALRAAAPSPTASLRELGSLEQAADVSAPLVAAAALLAWALLAQLLLVALLTLATALPGRTGALGDAALRRCAPAGLRRAVALALGIGLLVGTGAGAASAAPAPGTAASSLDWPTATPPALDWPAPAEPVHAPAALPVSVAPGDSLWSLARAALPADATAQEVARAWPSWWAANRAVIGDDPDLIHPGQSLRAPR